MADDISALDFLMNFESQPSIFEFGADIVGFDCLAELSGMDPRPEKWVCPFKSDDMPGSGCGSEHPDTCPLMKQYAEIKAKVAPSTWTEH